MTDSLPSNLRLDPDVARRADDSLFWMSATLYPEIREPFWPQRTFELDEGAGANKAAKAAQEMGLQYAIHAQQRRDPAISVIPGSKWNGRHLLLSDLDAFAEEPCEWHYPKVTVGYNVEGTEPSTVLRPDVNTPRVFGYMPNGDVVAYWKVAERLADHLDVELEGLHSSIDGRCLVVATGVDEDTLLSAPVGQGVETGVLLSRRELHELDAAIAYIEGAGGQVTVLEPAADYTFYRLRIPVFRSELNLNPYLDQRWEPFDVGAPRLVGYDFKIVDHPGSRDEPIFATERGNLIASTALFEELGSLLSPYAVRRPKGTPVVRAF